MHTVMTEGRCRALCAKGVATNNERMIHAASGWFFIVNTSLAREEQMEQLASVVEGNTRVLGEAPLAQRFALYLLRRGIA